MRVRQMVVGAMGVCCYIVSCEKTKRAVAIDPGGEEGRILAALEEDGLTLERIVNTHCHPDHTCANAPIKAATGAPIVMHAADAAYIADPEVRRFFAMLCLGESPPPDETVEEGDEIVFGEERLKVLHTPGHTPGGMCLYSAPHCFTGDTLFVDGCGRTDFPGGSMRELTASIRDKLFTLPPDTIVWPGHGYGGLQSTIGKEAAGSWYL